MKITLPKEEIEKFLNLSSYIDISDESIKYSPVTEFIKIEIKKGFCKMTLTSVKNYISYTFVLKTKEEDCEILLSYTKLKTFYSIERKETLIIDYSETKTNLTDGKFKSSYQKKEDVLIKDFPVQPILSGLPVLKADKVLIERLLISKKYILDEKKDKLRPIFNVTSIKDNMVLSTDAHISCIFKLDSIFSDKLCTFTPKEIGIIKNFDFFDYIITDNWNIIKNKTVIFGSKIIEGLDTGSIHGAINQFLELIDKSKYMRINVDQFYNFCKSVKPNVKDETLNTQLEVTENGILLSYSDIQNSYEANEIIDSEIIGYPIGYKILFIQSAIVKVLDSLNESVINLSECIDSNGNKNYIAFWLNSDKSFSSICSKGFEVKNEIKRQEEAIDGD